MKEVLPTSAIALVTGLLGWLFSKLQTRREQKESDLQLINKAISPLLASIRQLTDQSQETVQRLLAEQDKVLKLMGEKAELLRERGELVDKIEKLEKQVNCLTTKINKLMKKENEA